MGQFEYRPNSTSPPKTELPTGISGSDSTKRPNTNLNGYNRPEHLRAFQETGPLFTKIQRPLRASSESANSVAADQLTWLAVGSSLNRHDLTAGANAHPANRLEDIATAAVEAFLHAYTT